MMIRVEVPELQKATDRLRNLAGRFRKTFLGDSIEKLQDAAVKTMDDEAPKGKRPDVSGSQPLKGSHFAIPTGDLSFNVVSSSIHGQFVIRGTQPHMIYPGLMSAQTRSISPKAALWWPGLKHPVQSVSHPGTAPNPYNERAAKNIEGTAYKIFAVLGARIKVFLDGG